MKIRKLPFWRMIVQFWHNRYPAHEKQLHQISKWLSANKPTLDLEATLYLKFGRTKSMRNTLRLNEKLLETENSKKYLGIFIDSDLKFENHLSYVCKNSCELVSFLRHCKYTLTRDLKLQVYKYFNKPIFEYGFLLYGSTSESQLGPVLILKKKIMRIIYNLRSHASSNHLLSESGSRTIYAM